MLIPLLATFVLLASSSALLATVGRRRRRQQLELGAARAMEEIVGTGLADLVADAIRLRHRIEDAAASGREMLTIEVQLGGALRRPLWRQIEDANFGHELDRVRRETELWLARFDGLDTVDRQVIELLGLDVAPVRTLVGPERWRWEDDAATAGPVVIAGRDRGEELGAIVQQCAAAVTSLRRLERELIDYRPGGYR